MKYKKNESALLVAIGFSILLSTSVVEADSSKRGFECNYYARNAVQQYKKNIKANCGFKGLRWNNNRKGQKKWCMTVEKSITDKEHNIRQQMLETCFKEKSSLSNEVNHPAIPANCKDPKGIFTPIKSIYSWYRYERELRTPVEEGLIKADFNQDRRLDYIFIEQNKKQTVQLTTCISDHRIYRRKVTSIHFSAKGDSLMGSGYGIALKGKQLQLSLTYFEHNAGSSFAEGFYAYNKNKKIFELKDSMSSSAGVPMEPNYTESYPIYVPIPPKIL